LSFQVRNLFENGLEDVYVEGIVTLVHHLLQHIKVLPHLGNPPLEIDEVATILSGLLDVGIHKFLEFAPKLTFEFK